MGAAAVVVYSFLDDESQDSESDWYGSDSDSDWYGAPASNGKFGTSPSPHAPKPTSTYFPIMGSRPYICAPVDRQTGQDQIAMRLELNDRGLYGQPNKKLLSEFFPARPRGRGSKPHGDILASLQEFYGDTYRPSARRKRRGKRRILTKGWKAIPKPPEGYEGRVKDKDITDALMPILNGIISHQGLSGSRVVVDCRQRYMPTFSGYAMTRHQRLFLWGAGSAAFPHTSGVPPSSALGSKKMTKNESLVDWRWCVIPILIKSERTRGIEKNQSVVQLAQDVREVFAAQPNRRYVPSLVFTETTLELFVWDRMGITFSEPLDYHAEAERFCDMIASIASWSDERLGFDTSEEFADGVVRILANDVTYVVDAVRPVIQPYSIVNNGMTCWLARRQDESKNDTTHLILDAWSDSWEVDKKVMAKIEELRSEGQLQSPADLVSFDVVQRPPANSVKSKRRLVVDSIRANRGSNGMLGNTLNLEHSRLVWGWRGNDCVPLEKFTSMLELVCVLRDVAQELKTLYLEHKIVHRDIAPWNIFIHRDAEAPPGRNARGFLIDYSHAQFMHEGDNPPRQDPTPGAYAFMPFHALENETTTHCDDLESVFYVLYFIIGWHTDFDLSISRLKEEEVNWMVSQWVDDMGEIDTNKRGKVAWSKRCCLENIKFNQYFRVQTVFKPLEPLAIELHRFFVTRHAHGGANGGTPEQDFTEFLGYFDETINELRDKAPVIPRKREEKDHTDGGHNEEYRTNDIDTRVSKRAKTAL
ncbi:hypothetical protein JB92DRAFT_2825564 [Gautieria morchelliformis]|nr:hypothetical protein JB92DRAFT_2825564 [Gautieria morchelliformis]